MRIWLLLILLGALLIVPAGKSIAQTQTCPPDSQFGCLEAPLPNFPNTNIDDLVGPGQTPFLTIATFFVTWLTVITVGSALIIIVAAGYVYMTAGGDGAKVQRAKTMVGAALLGVFLAVGAYLILNTISSQFTSDVQEPKLIVPAPGP